MSTAGEILPELGIGRCFIPADAAHGICGFRCGRTEARASLMCGQHFRMRLSRRSHNTASPPLGDGLALDVHGNVYVALAAQCAIVRIDADDRSQETIAALLFDPQNPLFAPFDFPTSLAFGTGKGGRESLFVAGLGWLGSFGFPGPGPGLVKIEVGVPGLPQN